jgi:hypothetical protein
MLLPGCFVARDRTGGEEPRPTNTHAPAEGRFDPATASATLTIGTDVVRGVVARWCVGADCQTVGGARPAGRITTDASSVVATIALEREPVSVQGVVRNGSKIVSTQDLQQLRIIAKWMDGETTWMFAVERASSG